MNPIEHAIALLKAGKLVAIPTETVYGLGADARNPVAIQNIYLAKERPSSNPLIIHISDMSALSDWAIDIPDTAFQLAKAFWPGPLTLILARHPSVPKIVTGGQESIAIRIPNHLLTLELLERFDGGIAAPSANRYGRISPTTTEHVRTELGSRVDYILEGGACTLGIESTIVSLLDDIPIILRQGSISETDLSAVLKQPVRQKQSEKGAVKLEHDLITPGSHLSHYAPTTPLYLCKKERFLETALNWARNNKRFCALSFSVPVNALLEQGVPDYCIAKWIVASENHHMYAQKLYAYLHDFDATKSDCLLIENPPNTAAWAAIRDRLQRAAS
ncbi:MAG TPA: L-threonylcarbamoyladenylate synthase [Gammaproteobacteria bacterium]|nr:L-threonylcarbamoyladenylate synthase [Gammaproteobacteria bacterium]HRA42684.1 L-threonylcarbamoyladenylate synthase [Gammaproteobacteria bacterium]